MLKSRLRYQPTAEDYKNYEMMKYQPEIRICFITRGTLRSSKPSRAMIDETYRLRQYTVDGSYFFGRDTYDHQNPLIYSKKHFEELREHYVAVICGILKGYFPVTQNQLNHKKLRGPFKTIVQEFDSCSHRKELFTLSDPLNFSEGEAEAILDAVIERYARN
jgi:hypothetical protein